MRLVLPVLIAAIFIAGCSTVTSVKLTGLVQSSKTDENDNPVAIYLWDGKNSYPIEKNDKMEQLLEKVDSKIEADAELEESWGGEKTITIEKYRVLKDAAD